MVFRDYSLYDFGSPRPLGNDDTLTRAYLIALGIVALRVSWVLGRARLAMSRASLALNREAVTARISTQLFGIDQVMGLFRHLFGMVLAIANNSPQPSHANAAISTQSPTYPPISVMAALY